MMKMLATTFAAAAFAMAAEANTVIDEDVVLYYDFETMAEDGYKVENIANPGVMQLDGGNTGLATVTNATPSAKIRQTRAAVPAGDSSKALTPSQFLRAEKAPGLMMIVW